MKLSKNSDYKQSIVNAFYTLYEGTKYQKPETLLLNILKYGRSLDYKELKDAIYKKDKDILSKIVNEKIEEFYKDCTIDDKIRELVQLRRM